MSNPVHHSVASPLNVIANPIMTAVSLGDSVLIETAKPSLLAIPQTSFGYTDLYRIDRFVRTPTTQLTIQHEWGHDPIAIRTATLSGTPLQVSYSIAPEQIGKEITFYTVSPISFFVSILG